MAMRNPVGRVNYQPNSHGEGPREDPARGFRHFPAEEQGQKLRLRPESFADHYSQARQFYISQTPPEQRHIAAALTFELSKVEIPAIRERMVSHLLNIDETLAKTVAAKLGLATMPKPAEAAVPTRDDLDPSPALSIIERGPKRFEGRKLGILVTDGVDSKLLKGLLDAVTAAKAVAELIAPKVGGVTDAEGKLVPAHHMIDGGPSVLFDAVAILSSPEGMADLIKEATARDFVADAFQHCKFIGYHPSALPLLEKAGVAGDLDEGTIALGQKADMPDFIEKLGKLRIWAREPAVKLGKASSPEDGSKNPK